MDSHSSPALAFISYSSADRPIAEAACESLETNGIRCWIAPRNVDPRVPYAGQIIQGLRESQLVIFLFSEHANQSANVLREIEFATNQPLPVLSVRLDQTVLSDDLAYYLRVVHWHDVSGRQSQQDQVSDLSAQVAKLLANVKPGEANTTPAAAAAAQFGDFEILAAPDGRPIELGRGGMGVTYRARQISMGGREVALKVINPTLMGDEGIRKRFLREAQIAGAIEHPNVALVYSRGQEGDSYFYAMQLVAGVDLDKYIKERGPLSVGQALSVTSQVAAALEAARTKGLIHRDIKPSNIMAVADRRNRLGIKLIDFGLAKNVGGTNSPESLISGGQFVGTFAFASPEQCRRQELDTRSDLYSLGVTLWFLLTGRPPFQGSPEEISGSHLFREPPFSTLPALATPVNDLIKSLLAKDPADRPQTPAELEDRVEELLRSLPADSPAAPSEIVVTTTPAPASGSELGMQTLIGSPALSNYLNPAAGETRDQRFQLIEELREGVSGRLFRAREAEGTASREVGVKFLHPSIVSDPENQKILREQFDRVRSLSIDHVIGHYSLDLDAQPSFLVREWLNGFSLSSLLRWKQTMPALELVKLLAPLPGLLDQLSQYSLALIEVSLGKIFLAFAPEVDPQTFPVLAKQSAEGLRQAQLKLNPLSLRGLVKRSSNADSDPTMLSTSRLLALTQAKMGIRGKSSVQLLGQLIYELLSGYPHDAQDTSSYTPLSAINEAGNRLLRAAIVAPPKADAFPNCESFWQAFTPTVGLTARFVLPASPTPRLRTDQLLPRNPPLPTPPLTPTPPPAPVYQPSTVSPEWPTSLAAGSQATEPAPFAKPAFPRSKKLSVWMIVWILVVAAAVGLVLFSIAILSVGRLMVAQRNSPTPSISPITTATPTPSVASVEATPQPTPSVGTSKQIAAQSPATANVTDLINQARSEAEAQQYDKAVTDYTEATRLKPDYAEAYNGRGEVYFKLKQYDKAVSDYDEAIRIKSDFAEAYSNRAFAYTRVGQFEKAIADCNEAIRIKPDFAEAYKNRANPHNGLKQYQDAIADSNEALRLKPDYAEAYVNRAISYNGLNQYDKAVADCDDAVRIKPKLFQAYLARGNARNQLEQYDKAIADLSQVIDMQPDVADAYFYRGYSYNCLKQYEAGIADSTEAIRLNPKYANAYNNRGYAHNCLKQYDAAIADYTEAIRADPNLVLAYSNRGIVYFTLKRYEAGIADYTEAIRLSPNVASLYVPRGYAYNCLKQYDLGIADCSEAIRLDPNLALAYLNRAFAYQQVHENEKARADRVKGERLQNGQKPGVDRPARK
jgi:serine/threonine protein kinase/tetratricopeptide (TPR) repeat protein